MLLNQGLWADGTLAVDSLPCPLHVAECSSAWACVGRNDTRPVRSRGPDAVREKTHQTEDSHKKKMKIVFPPLSFDVHEFLSVASTQHIIWVPGHSPTPL